MRTISVVPAASKAFKAAHEAIQYAKERDQEFWRCHRKEDIFGQRVRSVSFSDTTFQFKLESGKNWQVAATDQNRVAFCQAPAQTLGPQEAVLLLSWNSTGEPTEWDRHAQAQRLIGVEITKLFYSDQLFLYGSKGELLSIAPLLMSASYAPMLYWFWEN
jgi:hypothetical protein